MGRGREGGRERGRGERGAGEREERVSEERAREGEGANYLPFRLFVSPPLL